MDKLIILLMISVFSTSIHAETGTWVGQWWENVYEQRIAPSEYQQLQQKTATKCEQKILWYTNKLKQNPSSEYYKYKLRSWNERCKEEATENPYIQKKLNTLIK